MTPVHSALLDSFSWLGHGFGTRHNGAWTEPDRTARLHQVHGDVVVPVSTPGDHGDGDALITATPNLWLEIRTADCVPVLIVDPRQKLVASVHAGWRGTAARIAIATVAVMAGSFGSQPRDLVAAIGPHIAACCFEVGEDVAAHFPGHARPTLPRPHVDLAAANREQLLESGLLPRNIDQLGHCTACDAAMFHSFRRDRGTGRMVSAIAILPA